MAQNATPDGEQSDTDYYGIEQHHGLPLTNEGLSAKGKERLVTSAATPDWFIRNLNGMEDPSFLGSLSQALNAIKSHEQAKVRDGLYGEDEDSEHADYSPADAYWNTLDHITGLALAAQTRRGNLNEAHRLETEIARANGNLEANRGPTDKHERARLVDEIHEKALEVRHLR